MFRASDVVKRKAEDGGKHGVWDGALFVQLARKMEGSFWFSLTESVDIWVTGWNDRRWSMGASPPRET